MAVRGLRTNRLRTALTTLGTVISARWHLARRSLLHIAALGTPCPQQRCRSSVLSAGADQTAHRLAQGSCAGSVGMRHGFDGLCECAHDLITRVMGTAWRSPDHRVLFESSKDENVVGPLLRQARGRSSPRLVLRSSWRRSAQRQDRPRCCSDTVGALPADRRAVPTTRSRGHHCLPALLALVCAWATRADAARRAGADAAGI
jgi:hypothetical protein